MESNNRKKYVMINRETGSNNTFAMLDAIGSDNESDIDNLLEDSDTEYVAEEPVHADDDDMSAGQRDVTEVQGPRTGG